MEERGKELTVEELLGLLRRKEGEFIIRVQPGGGEKDARLL